MVARENGSFQNPRDETVPTLDGKRTLRSGDGQGGGGQKSRRRGSKPCPALEAGKLGEPCGGQESILLSPPTSPPVAIHTGRGPGRGGDEEGTSCAAPGGDEESNPVR